MEELTRRTTVVGAESLASKEGYLVGPDGYLTSAANQMGWVVSDGSAIDLASEAIVSGRCQAYVDGTISAVSAYDPLRVDGDDSVLGHSSIAGVLSKGTIGTDRIRAYALEATSTLKLIDVWLITEG